ncbi:MAG: efflux RND transporter periplasmic adaptor subunit, partial [Alsobacter sp.]
GHVDVLTTTLTIPAPPPPPAAHSSMVGELIGSAVAQDIRNRFAARDTSLWLVAGGGFLGGLLCMALWRRRPVAQVTAALVLIATGLAPRAEAASPPTAPGAPATAASVVTRDVSQRFADGALFVPKPTQRILAIRTLFTEVQTFPGAVELPARVIPDPAGAGLVQASVAGRLAPPPEGFPRLGARVAAGDVLALVQPSVGAADVTTQQQQSRELDQQIAITERRLERFRQIQGVVARAQIEDAELELAGLRTRRANLERAPREPERLLAPVSGVIAAVQATAGQIAEPNAVIFQIVDPSRYWVEASSFESHPIEEVAVAKLADGRSLALHYRGSGLADRNQAIPIHFAVDGETRGLRAGQFLTVLARTRDERRGIAVPRAGILRGANGQTIVYEHTNAERFVPREVRVESLDGERVLIVSGVEPGRRIVTQGAELLNQIR